MAKLLNDLVAPKISSMAKERSGCQLSFSTNTRSTVDTAGNLAPRPGLLRRFFGRFSGLQSNSSGEASEMKVYHAHEIELLLHLNLMTRVPHLIFWMERPWTSESC